MTARRLTTATRHGPSRREDARAGHETTRTRVAILAAEVVSLWAADKSPRLTC